MRAIISSIFFSMGAVVVGLSFGVLGLLFICISTFFSLYLFCFSNEKTEVLGSIEEHFIEGEPIFVPELNGASYNFIESGSDNTLIDSLKESG